MQKEPDIVVGVKAADGETYYLGAYHSDVVSDEFMEDFLRVLVENYLEELDILV